MERMMQGSRLRRVSDFTEGMPTPHEEPGAAYQLLCPNIKCQQAMVAPASVFMQGPHGNGLVIYTCPNCNTVLNCQYITFPLEDAETEMECLREFLEVLKDL